MTPQRKETSVTSLFKIDEIGVNFKWTATVLGQDGKIYGIPKNASYFVQINPTDKSMKEIGPDLDLGDTVSDKFSGGVITDGVIYAIPLNYDKVVKIDTNDGANNGSVTIIDAELPERGSWSSGAKSKLDGFIYCMPLDANRILKIEPEDDDGHGNSFESVGEDLGETKNKFSGTVADKDGVIVGIPYTTRQIIKFDPENPDSSSNVGEKADEVFDCGSGGVLATNGNMYCCNAKGDILSINVAKGSYSWIRTSLTPKKSKGDWNAWSNPVIGKDGCIYWPPETARCVMKFDSRSKNQSLVGGKIGGGRERWGGGALVSNGMIYCIPSCDKRILEINSKPVIKVGDGTVVGQNLLGDNDTGPDHLGVEKVAHLLADYLASKKIELPFVLGILGKWGTGKSYFFNLMKQRLIRLQKDKVEKAQDNPNAGHIYCITFDAWTYGKDNLWASLMYRIFKDLSLQLELESILLRKDPKVLMNGKVSIIELVDKLSKREMKYLEEVAEHVDDTDIVHRLIDYEERMGGQVSNSFSAIFKEQIKEDGKDLERAMLSLNENTNMTIWKALLEEDDKCNTGAINIFQRIILEKMKHEKCKEDEGKPLKMQKMTLRQLKAEFDLIEKMRVILFNMPLLKLFTLFFIVAIISGAVALWEKYGQEKFANFGIPLGGVTTGAVAVYNLYKQQIDYLTKCAEQFLDETKIAKGNEGDIESTYYINERIQIEKKKIYEIKRRLTIIEGESMQSVVKDRLESGVYVDKLGIVHQAKEDLDRLAAAMRNKYLQDQEEKEKEKEKCPMFQRGKPRIVLFIDDLDRCEPDKVITVLEAMQLLVKTDLFVVVAAIDLRYVCLSLEKRDKYKNVLDKHNSPTSMDYLEKIIQIPYRLPMISDDGMEKFIEAQNMASVPVSTNGNQAKHSSTETSVKEPVTVTEQPGQISPQSMPNDADADAEADADANAAADDYNDGKKISKNDDDEVSVNVLETQIEYTPQTLDDIDIEYLNRVCKIFKPSPRAVKRVINVFKIMKIIWHNEKMDESMLKINSINLLVMASSDPTKKGIHKIFNMMENEMEPQYAKKNLRDLIIHHCGNAFNDANAKEIIIKFKDEKFDDKTSWKEISNRFRLARSFSFFMVINEELDEQNEKKS